MSLEAVYWMAWMMTRGVREMTGRTFWWFTPEKAAKYWDSVHLEKRTDVMQDDVVNKTCNGEFQVLTFHLSTSIRKQKGFPVWLYTDNHSTWGTEAGGLLWIQCHFGLHRKFQVSDKTGTTTTNPIKIRVSFNLQAALAQICTLHCMLKLNWAENYIRDRSEMC